MSDQNSSAGKRVINSHIGLQNVLDLKNNENMNMFIDTLDNIIKILLPHCGPYSKYAMIVDEQVMDSGSAKLTSPDIFSKDGIELLESVEYTALIQKYLKNNITYIGREVDNKAKDGTTTAMIVAAGFLSNCLAHKDKIEDLNLTTVEQRSLYKELEKLILDKMNEYSYSIEKLSVLFPIEDTSEYNPCYKEQYWAGIIAYTQAMSSSGGDIELAKCMREIFSNILREAWDHQTWFDSRIETDELYTIYHEPYDYALKADFQTMNLYNKIMQTEWLCENVRVLAIPDGMCHGDICTVNLIDYVKNFRDTENLCIITNTAVPELIKLINDLNVHRTFPIAHAIANIQNKKFTNYTLELAVLNAIASVTPYIQVERDKPLTDDYTFVVDKIKSYGAYMEFYGIYDHDSTKPIIHPNYLNPLKCEYYTTLLNDLKYIVEHLEVAHQRDDFVYKQATIAIKDLICQHIPTVRLGGTTHDIIANKRVIQDVIGATMESVTNHFFINGVLTMKNVLLKVSEEIDSEDYVKYSDDKLFMHIMINAFSSALDVVIEKLYHIETMNENDYANFMHNCKFNDRYFNILIPEWTQLSDFISNIENVNYPVIQPIVLYQEILNRVGELILRLISTDKVIVPNGVYIK